LKLTFHLAGINNQNFIMRDDETGTYWQQISGAAISGPLAGRKLRLIPCDELTFSLWKTEQPQGTVLKDVTKYAAEYAPKDWDVKMKKARTVISYPETGIGQRDVMLGVHAFGGARAFPYEAVLREKLVQDRVGTEPVVLVVGPDGQSVRAFRARVPGLAGAPDFYRTVEDGRPLIMDSATGSTWNFQGCATEGKARGVCLDRIDVIKDYWFDWRHYNPGTTIYRAKISDR
jgi:Protein of unknown function (DUF3179)